MAWFNDLKSNGYADPGLAIRLNWATRACVGALVGLDFFAVSAEEILALFPGPPSGVLALKGLTEEEDKAIEGELRIRVPLGHRGGPANWYEDESYIINGIMKLRSLYGLQGDLDLLCRQVEAAPSLARFRHHQVATSCNAPG
jgi:hypothetical protein